MVFLLLAISASYLSAMSRPVAADEVTSADFGLVLFVAWTGVFLVAHDINLSIPRIVKLFRVLVTCVSCMALLGLVQFITGQTLVDQVSIPGLVENIPINAVAQREGFNRPSGTALHAIEFSVVVTMMLPMALTLVLHGQSRSLIRRLVPVVLMAASVPIALSRSALVGAVVGLAVLLPTWPKVARRWLLVFLGVGIAGVFVLVPGILGALADLFTGIGSDSSALSRTGSYSMMSDFLKQRPLFGRGLFTLLPKYRTLDNQYAGLLIDIGVVGTIAFLALPVTGIAVARRIRQQSMDQLTRDLAAGLAAGIATGAVGFALFDGLSFPMASGLLFLQLGIVGALWRKAVQERR
jgi:O-antigen ligase